MALARFSIHRFALPAQKERQTALGWERARPGGDSSAPLAGGWGSRGSTPTPATTPGPKGVPVQGAARGQTAETAAGFAPDFAFLLRNVCRVVRGHHNLGIIQPFPTGTVIFLFGER